MEKATKQEEKLKIIEDALAQSEYNRQADPGKAEDMEKYLLTMLEKITKYDNAGISFVVNKDLGLHNNLIAAKEFFNEYNVVKHLPDVFGEGVKLTVASITAPVSIVGKAFTIGDTTYSLYKNYDKHGFNQDFAQGSIVDFGKACVFTIIDSVTGNVNKAIVIMSEANISVWIDQTMKVD